VGRLRPIDRLVVAVAVPGWLVCMALGLRSAGWQITSSPVILTPTIGTAHEYPDVRVVRVSPPSEPPLRIGDRLLAVGGRDFAGKGGFDLRIDAHLARRGSGTVPMVFERDGRRVAGRLLFPKTLAQGWLLAASAFYVAAALLLIARAPEIPAAQAAFAMMLAVAAYMVSFFGTTRGEIYAAIAIRMLGASLIFPFALRMSARFLDEDDNPRWIRGWPWLLLAMGPVGVGAEVDGPIPPLVATPLFGLIMMLAWGGLLGLVTRKYRAGDAAARRRWRLVCASAFLVGMPQAAAVLATIADYENGRFIYYSLALTSLFPVAVVTATLRHKLFDIDRVLSATATYLLTLLVFAAGLVFVMPRAAAAAAELLGIGRGAAQLVVLGLLAALLVSLAQRIRPLIDRVLLAEQRAVEEDLRKKKDAADRENLAKSTFLATASHDLRQPLHALGLFVGALEDKVHDPEARALVKNIQASTQAMEEMFNAVLDVSRLDAGVLEAHVGDVPLGTLLARLRTELEPIAATRDLALRVVPTTLVVRSDPLLLRRILQNLITNALRYTDRGKVLVGCTRRGAEVRIHVCDTGRGIAPEVREQIFDEYHRAAGEDARSQGGLGLGLAIVRRLVRLLDHHLDLRSTPGRGSIFTLTAPRGERDAAARAADAAVGGDVAGLRVLAIDDDPSILDGMRALLEPWGCTVRTARSGRAACQALASGDGAAVPDVILADYELAGGETGADAIASVRAAVGSDVPALLITGDTAPTRATEARAAGFLLLTKPLAPMRLRAGLAHLAGAARRARTRP
jgi:signal transduction histidine kinase/CheY-like chemotaxis protein